jgi:hypothetical protein
MGRQDMEWIRMHGDRLLLGAAGGCIALALAVLGYAALAITPGAAIIVTLFTGATIFAAWAVWFTTRRITRSRRDATHVDHHAR